jgi:4-amino-4-deoxy-L-arabinose transferase-like glycosyltransferase
VNVGPSAEARPAVDRSVWFAAALAVVLLLIVGKGGYHRDELYFLQASRHMAWGYVDQPPFSIAMVWVSSHLFGSSLLGLRLFPALADGAAVVLAGLLARELGGGRFPQTLASVAVAVGPFLVAGHIAGPTIYDFAAWALASLLLMRILRGGDRRAWLVVGAAVGVALLDKETVLFLIFGLIVGFVVNGQRKIFASPWLWAGAGIALLIWSPTLVWEARNGWPTIEMWRNLRAEHSGLGSSLTFVPIQLLLPGIWVAPVWIAGLWALLREERWRVFRAFGIAYVTLFVLLWIFLGDRPYYLAGLYPLLLAAGAVVTEGVVVGVRRFFSDRRPRRRVVWRSERASLGFVLVTGLLTLPLSLPVLPPAAIATVPLQGLNYNLGEVIGWPELVSTVADVYRSLPPSDRASTVIVTANYGEAGAIDRYGPAIGLPRAYSGHNNEWWWGPPQPSMGTTIFVGFDRPSSLGSAFGQITRAATFSNPWGVDNDEEGTLILVGREQRAPWPVLWPDFRSYG